MRRFWQRLEKSGGGGLVGGGGGGSGGGGGGEGLIPSADMVEGSDRGGEGGGGNVPQISTLDGVVQDVVNETTTAGADDVSA